MIPGRGWQPTGWLNALISIKVVTHDSEQVPFIVVEGRSAPAKPA